jgi:hypothetical protein
MRFPHAKSREAHSFLSGAIKEAVCVVFLPRVSAFRFFGPFA